MNTHQTLRGPDLPEYASGSVGKPDLGSIANRVRELAALLEAEQCDVAAGHLTQAYGALLGVMAARGLSSPGAA